MSIHATVIVGGETHYFGIGGNDDRSDDPKFSQVPLMTYQYTPPSPARQERQVLGGKPILYRTGERRARLVCRGNYGAPTAGPSTRMLRFLQTAFQSGGEVVFTQFPDGAVQGRRWYIEDWQNPCTKMENGHGVEYSYTMVLREV